MTFTQEEYRLIAACMVCGLRQLDSRERIKSGILLNKIKLLTDDVVVEAIIIKEFDELRKGFTPEELADSADLIKTKKMAERFNISPGAIRSIKRGDTWSHVKVTKEV